MCVFSKLGKFQCKSLTRNWLLVNLQIHLGVWIEENGRTKREGKRKMNAGGSLNEEMKFTCK